MTLYVLLTTVILMILGALGAMFCYKLGLDEGMSRTYRSMRLFLQDTDPLTQIYPHECVESIADHLEKEDKNENSDS